MNQSVYIFLIVLLISVPMYTTAQQVFEMNNQGYVLVEAENLPHSDQWELYSKDSIRQVLGMGMLKYVGPVTGSGHGQEIDRDGSLQPAEKHWIKVPVQINETGRYRINLRNHHMKKDGDNDIWVHIKGWEPPVRRVGDHAVDSYQWLTWGPDRTYFDIAEPGLYEFYIAGRSAGFYVDRIAIYNEKAPITMFHRESQTANE